MEMDCTLLHDAGIADPPHMLSRHSQDSQAATRAAGTGRQTPRAPSQPRRPAAAFNGDASRPGVNSNYSYEHFALPLSDTSATRCDSTDFDSPGLYNNNTYFSTRFFDDGLLYGMDLVTGAPLPAFSGHGPASQDVPATAPANAIHDSTIRADMEAATDFDAPSVDAPSVDAPNVPATDAITMPAPPLPDVNGTTSLPQDVQQNSIKAEGLDQEAQLLLQPTAQNGETQALDATITLDQPMNVAYTPELPLPDDMFETYAPPAAQKPRLSAFARLRFNDGSYYMHTYSIILGRDVELARRDLYRVHKAEKLRREGDVEGAEAVLRGKKRKRRDARPRSVISQTGGILSAPMSAMPADYQQCRQPVASHSVSSSSHRQEGSSPEEQVDQAPQHLIMQTFPELPDQLDSHVSEDPNYCPRVNIHPQNLTGSRGGLSGPKGISREHAKIYYNFDTGSFEVEVLGLNGLKHEGTMYPRGAVIELSHGDTFVIGMVEISFYLPDIALTEEQRARQDSDSRPMSFSFENGHGEVESDEMMDDESGSEEVSVDPRHVFHMPYSEYDSEEDIIADEEDEDDEDEDEDEPSSPDLRRKKPVVKPKLKIKLKNKHKKLQVPPPRKEVKHGYKRKPVREPTPEDEPVAKRPKTKLKEFEKEPPKEKGKAPAKIPAAKTPSAKTAPGKSPAKEPPQVKEEKKSEPAKAPKPESPLLARKPIEGGEDGDDGEQEGTITAEMVKRHNLPESLIGMVMEKRKGPGRPPKDGVMSKRQRAQLVKQGKEIEKAKAAGVDPADIPMTVTKPKVARPRKDSNVNEGDDEEIRETTEKGDGSAMSGDKKPTKINKPPRTPSPEMKIEDYTEEQLQRPSANYVVLIHEAISSSKTGQMNLQQIYNYIERKYPWYKFKTTTSGWQSSVRHNLGQHDAFVKGDKEGKGFNWKVNPEVSIEKERRKRQVSPQLGPAPNRGYYPPPNGGYPPYGPPGSFYPGMPPQGAPNGGPRPPPSVDVQPRLPPSLARSAAAATPAAPGTSNTSPYSSPWAGGNTAGNAANQNPPRPFPQPPSQTPPASSTTAPSGQYGVLFPTSAPPSNYGNYSTAGAYGNHNTTTGATPYPNAPNRPYTPYATASSSVNAPQTPYGSAQPPPQQHNQNGPTALHPSGRYPVSTNPALIHQLEAFRGAYLEKTPLSKSEEAAKVDNVIRVYLKPSEIGTLTSQEQDLLTIIRNIPTIKALGPVEVNAPATAVKQENSGEVKGPLTETLPNGTNGDIEAPKTAATSTAAAIAASDAAVAASGLPNLTPASTTTTNTDAEPIMAPAAPTNDATPAQVPPPTGPATIGDPAPQKFAPNMGDLSTSNAAAAVVPSAIRIQTSRPSVEPLTPVPGSPMIAHILPAKSAQPEATGQTDTEVGAKESFSDVPTNQADTSTGTTEAPEKQE